MQLVMVTGFLGSGKTSLIIRLADAARAADRSVAIVVNEVGEIGIDDKVLRQLDLDVWELTNGCICCSLAGDLIETLHKLDESYAPDLVVVEASGAADPASILAALPYYRGRELQSTRWISVLDPYRLPMLLEVMTPLVTSGIRQADQLVVTREDVASAAEIESAAAAARAINPAAPIHRVDLTGPLAGPVADELLS
jgi:G3E family GTPase